MHSTDARDDPSPQVEARNRGTAFLAAVAGLFVYTSATSFLSVGLGPAGRRLGMADIEVGAILSSGTLAGILFAPIWGLAAERFSRRRLMLLAVPFIALSSASMALAFCSSTALTVGALFHALLALRFLLAAFGAATVPLAQSFVATFTEERRRVSGMGLMSVAISSGTVIGSALLWAAATTGIAASLLVIAAMGAGALIVVYGFLPYSIPRTVPTSTKRAAQIVTVLPYLGITFVGFVAYSMVVPLIGLRLIDRFGLNSDAALGMSGLALTCASLTLLLAHVGVAARPGWRAPSLLRVGSLGALGGLTMLVVATNVVLLVAAMATVGLSLGLVGPANLGAMSLASGKDVQGKVGGLNAAARGLGISVGPITGTALYEVNQDLPLIAAMALICVAFGLSFLRPDATAHA